MALRASWWRALAGVFAGLLVAFPALAQQDRFDVRSAFVEPVEGVWHLGATLDLSLSDAAREALAESIPLELRLDIVVSGERAAVHVRDDVALGNFATLDQALELLSRPRGLPLIDAALLREGRRHEISVRATLEIVGVPTALKLVLFWREWSRTTDWYTWSFRP